MEEGGGEEEENAEEQLSYLCKLLDNSHLPSETSKIENGLEHKKTENKEMGKQTAWQNSVHNVVNTFNMRNFDLLVFSNDNESSFHMAIFSGSNILKKYKNSHTKQFFCRFCGNSFSVLNSFYYHIGLCKGAINFCYTTMPKKIKNKTTGVWEAPKYRSKKRGNYLSLFCGSFDTETLNNKLSNNEYRLDVVCAFAYVFKVLPIGINEPEVVKKIKKESFEAIPFVGPDCMKNMFLQLFKNAQLARERTKKICAYYEKYCISEELLKIKKDTKNCGNCSVEFKNESEKCLHHSHILGSTQEYRPGEYKIYGSYENVLCGPCNLKMSIFHNYFVVYSHNFCGFDSKLCLKSISECVLNKQPLVRKVDIIARNSEKVISLVLYPFCNEHYVYANGVSTLKNKSNKCHCFPKICLRDSLGFFGNRSLDSITKLLKEQGSFFGNDEAADILDTMATNSNIDSGAHSGETENEKRALESTFGISAEFYSRIGLTNYVSLDKLSSKLCFPYNCFTDFNYLTETTFPVMSQWKDDMRHAEITQKEYDDAYQLYESLGAWARDYNFTCNMGLMLQVYCMTDVLNLSCLLKEYILGYFKCFQININRFLSPASASFEVYLKNIENFGVDYITCPLTFNIFKAGLTGGVCDASIKYFEANHPTAGKYNPLKPKRQIFALDATQQYPSILANNALGTGNYRLWSAVECQNLYEKMCKISIHDSWTEKYCFFKKIDKKQLAMGLTLVCTLECPDNMHGPLNYFPPFTERKYVTLADLGIRQQRSLKGQKIGLVPRLCQTLGPVVQQTLDWRFLKYLIKLGIKVLSVNFVIEYSLSFFARGFFEKNAFHRSMSKNKIIQSIFKNCSSHVFGKCCQDATRYTNAALILHKTDLQKKIKDHNFKQLIEISENCFLTLTQKRQVKLTSNVQVAFTCLNLAKLSLMQKYYEIRHILYYNFNMFTIRSYYDTDQQTNAIFHTSHMSTDEKRNLICFSGSKIHNYAFPHLNPLFHRSEQRDNPGYSDVHCALRYMSANLDSSELDESHPYFSCVGKRELAQLRELQKKNRKRLGTWSFDVQHTIASLVCLRAKTYSFELYDNKKQQFLSKLRCKGIRLSQVPFFSHSTYKSFLFKKDLKKYVKQTLIFSKKQMLYKKTIEKCCFSSGDSKRYTLGSSGPWQTLAFGSHYIDLVREIEIILVGIIDIICATQL